MRFCADDGHREVLWVEPLSEDTYRVLNVPVFQYGVSVGTIVRGEAGDPWLEYRATVTPSRGATVRLYLPRDSPVAPASRFYLERVFPDCSERELAIGPATFFDPRVVAIHLHHREEWESTAAAYFNGLVDEGLAMLWEIGDPDAYPPDEPDADSSEGELVHPRPTADR